ncbi:hypothetical protein VTL71DRAFT_14717 [Oculimacula yallundae]|uniref:CFEM domain-containing protein n=1 Tax=Oculimacula yallundae TaxID=86028 RepID=A0ABR4CKL0_9HELO
MKKALVAVFSLALALPFTLAVKTGADAIALLSELPPCALTCLATSVANSTCAPTDTACVCSNVPLNAVIAACVQSSCTIKQSLTTLNITHHLCEDPIRDRRKFYNTLNNVFGIASAVAVLLRFYSRWKSTQPFWYDDYSIGFLLIIGIPSTIMNVQGLTYNGLGLDIWQVGFRQITDFIHVFFAMELLYFIHVGLVKLSILFFFLRLFPCPTFRKWVWGTIILNTIITFLFLMIGILQCAPIRFYWKRWDNEHRGSCLNINALGWSNAGISIAFDIWMLGLPMTQLRSLKLHWKKKLAVASMFSVGAFVTIVSIIRLRSLVKFSASQNPTWDYIDIGSWSTVEINVAIICACMPNIRLLLVRYFPRFMETTTKNSSHTLSDNRNEGKRRMVADNSYDDSSNGSRGSTFGRATFSSKVPDDSQEAEPSSVELVSVGNRKDGRVESRMGSGDEDDALEPDHERDHQAGNWV